MDRRALKTPASAPQPAWRVVGLGALWLALLGAGCVTTAPDSDIPWNTPQPWETAPSIPGLNH